MYEMHAKEKAVRIKSDCELYYFEDEERMLLEDFGVLAKLREKFVGKDGKQVQPFPSIRLSGSVVAPIVSFRNYYSLSKFTFFEENNVRYSATYSLTEAACYLGNSNWALFVYSMNKQKLVIIERDQDEISELSEYCLEGLDFEWTELKYCMKDAVRVIVLFGGFYSNRTQILVFQIMQNRTLQLISKKTSVC